MCLPKVPTATAILILLGSSFAVWAQRPANPSQPLRDAVRSMSRREMDRMLTEKPITATSTDPTQQMALKQIRADFKDLQSLNNRMMSDSFGRATLDYEFVGEMISDIRKRATRLKGNLNLPKIDDAKHTMPADPLNEGDFKSSMFLLDKTIMNFVTNPIFQMANRIEIKEATRARQDLELVIFITTGLRKAAEKFQRNRQPNRGQP